MYGVDSTKSVRSDLIDLLYDRVRYHKDKFISPIIYHEMETMQVKKRTGKVEHADGAHDDQVFSYLMALYVLFMGNDIMERWGIQRTVLKTDEDKEIEESLLESESEAVEAIDKSAFEEEKEIVTEEDRIEDEFWKTSKNIQSEKQFQEELKNAEDEAFNLLLSQDPGTQAAYKKKYNSLPLEITSQGITQLDDSVFMGANGYYEDEEARREARRKHNGNLYDIFCGL